MKNTTLLAGVALGAIAVAAPAQAADLRMPVKAAPAPAYAPAPVMSWTGCYIGMHVGWGWGKKDTGGINGSDTGSASDVNTLTGSVKTSGAMFGGQLGCDYQFNGAWVLGIQGSLSAADINGDEHLGASLGSNLHTKTDSLSSITGRLGWTGWGAGVMIYINGGFAWAHDRNKWTFAGAFVHPCESYGACFTSWDETRSGWVLGGGVEWRFTQNWSAFVEYDHYLFEPWTLSG